MVEKLIESGVMLNRDEEAIAYLARYRAAFLREHALWAKTSQKPLSETTKLPDLPPCFSSIRMSLIVMPRSTALHMS